MKQLFLCLLLFSSLKIFAQQETKICTACDKVKIDIPASANVNATATSATFSTSVTVTPNKVKTVTTDLVYFSQVPENNDCIPCNTVSQAFGNISGATLAAPGFPAAASIPYGHEATWTSTNPLGVMLNGSFSFNISLPPPMKCCKEKLRLCIRYIFLLDDCTVCEKVICYSFTRNP